MFWEKKEGGGYDIFLFIFYTFQLAGFHSLIWLLVQRPVMLADIDVGYLSLTRLGVSAWQISLNYSRNIVCVLADTATNTVQF